MSRVHDAVKDGVSNRRVANGIIPARYWELGGDNDGLASMSVFNDIQKDWPLLGIQRNEEEVVQDE